MSTSLCFLLLWLSWSTLASAGPIYSESLTPNPYTMSIPLLAGFKHNIKTHWTRYQQGEKDFEIDFSTDDFGRRISSTDTHKKRGRFLLFFGDSNIFGQGLNDSETIPWIVGAKAKNISTYNYALPGYGPGHFFLLVKNIEWRKEVLEENGYAIYSFYAHDIQRLNGDTTTVYAKHFYPALEMDKDGKIQPLGSMGNAHPVRSFIYEIFDFIFGIWPLKNYFLSFPKISENQIKFFCATINESAARLKGIYPKLKFYFLFHPNSEIDVKPGQVFSCLNKSSILFLNYAHFANELPWSERRFSPIDGHASLKLNKVIAHQIIEDLQL